MDADEDNYDIYADLDEGFNATDSASVTCVDNSGNSHQLADNMYLTEVSIMETNMSITQTNNNALKKQNEELRELLSKKEKLVLVLKTNISSLYKTAKAEIERKNREISELRDEYDSLIFKRITENKLLNRYNRNTSYTASARNVQMCDKTTDTSDNISIKNRRNHNTDRYVDNCFRHRKCSRSRSRSRGRHVIKKSDDCRHRRSASNTKRNKANKR